MRWLLILMLWSLPALAQDARYRVEIRFDWSGTPEEGHPADKHWSRLIAFAHSGKYSLFRDGDTASSGLALVATNGRVSVLKAELAEAERRKRVTKPIVLPGIEGSGTFTFEVTLDEKRSHIAFATMLAPSPDWFSGASGINMRDEGGNWIATTRIPLWPWDAGADRGATFQSPNAPTQPKQSIRLLTHPAFLTPKGMTPIGEATFTRLAE